MLHSGRPFEFDKDHLKALLKEESHQTSQELAEKMNCDQKMILNHLHSMGFAEKLGVWVPHELSENNKENRLQIASQHLACHQATRSHKQCFLYQIIMGDEKWCLYEVCSKSIRPFSLSPIRYEQTACAKCGCTHTHSRLIVKRFRPIRHSYLSV